MIKNPVRCIVAVFVLTTTSAIAQKVSDPKASYIDVQQRRAQLAQTTDPRTKSAIASLNSCMALPVIQPPTGRMIIPPHYLSGGHGPTNPAEGPATRPYNNFEHRVTAGMNQWLVTGNKDEAKCAQEQIDLWAKANTLYDYDPKESSQAWFQVEWTLSSIAISESVLLHEPSLDADEVKRGYPVDEQGRAPHRRLR
ncbi:MAG: hypothetical protein WDN23_21235 [Edaphobacter sp.]